MDKDTKKFDINKPWRYNKDWLIFPETVFNEIQILDCNDTTRGVCINNKTLEECIGLCKLDDKYCGAGYHIKFRDGRTICAALRTDVLPHLNVSSRLRRQSVYPEFNDVTVNTFINTNRFSFPPNQANVIHYNDVFSLQNMETGLTLGVQQQFEIKEGDIAKFNKEDTLNVSFISKTRASAQVAIYIPILYGDHLNIYIPNTPMMLNEKNDQNILVWAHSWEHELELIDFNFPFQILPISKDKKIGDPVTYSDHFTLQYLINGNTAVLNPFNNTFEIHTGNYERIKSHDKYYPTFSCISKMKGYYCEDGKCKTVPITEMDITNNGLGGSYKGNMVGWNPACYGQCDYEDNNLPSRGFKPIQSFSQNNIWILIIITVIIVIIIFLYFLFFRKL